MYVYDVEDFIDKNNQDIVSYLMIKAYQNHLDNQQTNGAMVRTSLNNSLIYDQLEGYKVVEAYDNIVKYLKENNKRNLFIDGLFVKTRMNKSNKAGFDLIEFNSFAEVHDDHLQDMQRDLLLLFEDPHTMQDAQALVNYTIVKDGMQFARGSFMQSILPVLYRDIIDANTGVLENMHQLFKSTAQTDAAFQNVFGKGMTKKALIEDLTIGFYKHVKTQKYIKPLIGSKRNKVEKKTEYFVTYKNVEPSQLKDENITIKESKGQSWDSIVSLINKDDKIHVFEGVSTGEHRLERVLGDKINADNLIQIPIMFDKDTHWADQGLKTNKDTIDIIIQDIINSGKDVVFHTSGPYVSKLKEVKEKAPQTYNYIKRKLLYAFGFNIETRKRETEKSGRDTISKDFPIVYDAKNNHEKTSESSYKLAEVEIDILTNAKTKTYVYGSKKDQYKKLKKIEIDNQKIIKDNIDIILNAQSTADSKKIFNTINLPVPGTKETQTISLLTAPIVFKIDIPKKHVGEGEYRRKTFILAEIDSPLAINMNNIYDTDNETIKKLGLIPGTRFKYIEYKPVGSPYTFSTAHALDGQLPAFEDIKKFINDLNKVTSENSISSLDINLDDQLYDDETEIDDSIITDNTMDSQELDVKEVGDNISYEDTAREEDAMNDMFGTDTADVWYKSIEEFEVMELPKLSAEKVQNIKDAFKIDVIDYENLVGVYEKMVDTIENYSVEEFIEELKKRCK